MPNVTSQIKISGKPAQPSIPERQETTRGWLAKAFFYLLAIVVVSGVVYIFFGATTPEKINTLEFLVSSLIGIVGVVIGFYFGQNTR